jgi:hypothetical protein
MTKQRKVTLFLITMTILSVALFMGKVSGIEYTGGITALYGLFITGNVKEHEYNKSNEA